MSDFDNLDKQRQTLLEIKLDGFVEAAVQTARLNNIGLSETFTLVSKALVREMVAYGIDGQVAQVFWENAKLQAYPEEPDQQRRLAS